MASTNIRKYRPTDRLSVVECMGSFGDYLVTIDSMKRQRRMPGFGEFFTQKMLESVDSNEGFVYVAEREGQIIGFAAGVIMRQSKEDLLECVPSTAGRVIELFVEKQFREQNIGTKLMEKMEECFRRAGCDVSKVEVFAPNDNAHAFYLRLGYQNRSVDMIKKL